MTKKKTSSKPDRAAKKKAGGGCPEATCSASIQEELAAAKKMLAESREWSRRTQEILDAMAGRESMGDFMVRDADAVEVFVTDYEGQRYSGSSFANIESARAWIALQPNRASLRVGVTAKFILPNSFYS